MEKHKGVKCESQRRGEEKKRVGDEEQQRERTLRLRKSKKGLSLH